MRHFIGQYPLNYTSVANERILVGLKQYGERYFNDPSRNEYGFLAGNSTATRKPLDHIAHILYPYHEHQSELLGRCGISTAVYDTVEKVGYDFFNEVGYAKLVSARYVDNYGIYEVVSHKSFYKVKTTTWVPQSGDVESIIRKIEVGSVKYSESEVELEVYPQLDLKGELYVSDGILISKNTHYDTENDAKAGFPKMDIYMAIGCPGAEGWYCGDFSRDNKEIAFNNNIEQPKADTHRPNVTFKITRKVNGKEWSKPVNLIIGLGDSEEQAIENLKQTQEDKSLFYEASYDWWKKWHQQGIQLETDNPLLNDVLGVSKTLIKLSTDEYGLTTYMGYYWYQGAVWIRDNSWVTMGLARMGYADDAYRVLCGLKDIVQKREDGSFNFIYGCRLRQPGDFSWESDSMGLILTAAGYWFDACQDTKKAEEIWEWLNYCAQWICDNVDESVGLMIPDAGIWEEWDEKYGREREHMVWTTLLSGYGIKKAADIAKALGKNDLADKYNEVYKTLRENLSKRCIQDGVLVRSPESAGRNLDTSVLYAWTWTPMLDGDNETLKNTLELMEDRLWDEALGGFWRHEYSGNDLGDTMPWPCSTMWLAHGQAILNNTEKVGQYMQWVLDNTSKCAQIPECMFNADVPHVTGMTSLSSIGIWDIMLYLQQASEKGFKLPENIRSIKKK